MLRSERASAGNGGVGRGCTTLSGCSTAIECDATGRKSPRQDRSNKPRREANGGAQCGKSARCVRRGGGWKRGAVETLRPQPARQSSTLPVRGAPSNGRPYRNRERGYRPELSSVIYVPEKCSFLPIKYTVATALAALVELHQNAKRSPCHRRRP